MASFQIKLTGNPGQSVQAYIDRKKQQIDLAMNKLANNCQARAQQNAPVDTGFLKNSIHVVKIGDAHYQVVVGASYGIFIELGHHTRSGSWVEARPFLLPAFVTTSKQAVAILQAIAKA